MDTIQQSPTEQNGKTGQSTLIKGIANFVSVICHPVFMPIVMALVIFKLYPAGFAGMEPKRAGMLFISIGFSTIVIPLFSILLMKPLGFIGSYKMPTARERTIPLMATMIFYFWISHVFNNIPGAIPVILKSLLLGNFWGIVLIFLANIFTRVSMHTAAAGGMIGTMSILLFISPANMIVPFFIAIVIAGIIGSARLILGAHQKGDVWLGYLIGIIVQFAAYFYSNL